MKNYQNFPDLYDGTRYMYNRMSIEHFNNGLDSNSLVDQKCTLYTGLSIDWHELANTYDKTHILFLALQEYICYRERKQEVKQLGNYIESTLSKLVEEDKIERQYLQQITHNLAKGHYGIDLEMLQNFIDKKLIDVHERTQNGHTLAMLTDNTKTLALLFKNGYDITAVLDNPESIYDKHNIYEIAVKQKKTALSKFLAKYLPESYLEQQKNESVNELRNENKITKQVDLYKTALIKNDLHFINEILDNPEKYSALLNYNKTGHTLLTYAIRSGKIEIVDLLINHQVFSQNKLHKTNLGYCYATVAMSHGKEKIADLLYSNGFKDDSVLSKYVQEKFGVSKSIISKLIENGSRFSVKKLFEHNAYEGIEKSAFSKAELDSFFNDNKEIYQVDNIKGFDGTKGHRSHISYAQIETGNQLYVVTLDNIKCLTAILKAQKNVDKQAFQKNLETFANHIGNNSESVSLKLGVVLLNNFPEELKNLLNYFNYSGKKDWVLKLNKENLEKFLEEQREQIETLNPKRAKI